LEVFSRTIQSPIIIIIIMVHGTIVNEFIILLQRALPYARDDLMTPSSLSIYNKT
jgi:hypothetical protein